MFRWLYILGALVLAVFLGGVLYFAQREADVWHEASGRTDGRGMPAVFDGFVERWNRSVERELLRDSFKIVNEFKKFITYHFKLGMIS